MRPVPNTVAAISNRRDMYRRTSRNSIPAANKARQVFRPCFLRHAGMSVNPAMAVESRGSSFSETPIVDESPANESRIGPAVLLHLRSGFRTSRRRRVELALVEHLHELDSDQNPTGIVKGLEPEHGLNA
jgi:hypothetical protein